MSFSNSGTINNYENARIVNYGSVDIENGGTIINKGSIANYGIINTADVLFIEGSIIGTGLIIGDVVGGGDIRPGASAGGFLVNGSLTLSEGSTKFIELANDYDANRDRVNTGYDFLDVTGDLILDGATIDVELIDGFELDLNQEFIIAKVDGELIGTYDGLEQGAIVGKFDSIFGEMKMNLFINYEAGDGNDIALSTSQIF